MKGMSRFDVRRLVLLIGIPLIVIDAGHTQEIPAVRTDNKNTLVLKHREKLQLSCSTFWPGWPVENAFDGKSETSWFSARGDSVAHGKKPWVQVRFPEDVKVSRVTILGNRDPAWLCGYTILAGKIELFDAAGKRIAFREDEGTGAAYDFDWKLDTPRAGVRSIRFTAQGDQGQQNPYDDIAIGEFQVE